MRHRNGKAVRTVETITDDRGYWSLYVGDRVEVWTVTCSCGVVGRGVTPDNARANGCFEARRARDRARANRRARAAAYEACGIVRCRVNGREMWE